MRKLINSFIPFISGAKVIILILANFNSLIINSWEGVWVRFGWAPNLSGLIVGKFTDIKDNKPIFGQNIYEIILQALEDFDFPICFNFPVGHQKKNTPLIINRNIKLEVDNFVKFSYT